MKQTEPKVRLAVSQSVTLSHLADGGPQRVQARSPAVRSKEQGGEARNAICEESLMCDTGLNKQLR